MAPRASPATTATAGRLVRAGRVAPATPTAERARAVVLDVVCEPGDGGPVDPASLPAPPPGPQLCAPEQFTCHDGQCIPAQAQCNGVEQCPDASDEIGCPEPDAGPPEEDGGRR